MLNLHKLAGHTNSYHTYSFDNALAGIAEAGYHCVEVSSVGGWTEHVDISVAPSVVTDKAAAHGLEVIALSAHSDLTTDDGVDYGVRAVQWAADCGLTLVTTAIGGHAGKEESKQDFLSRIPRLAQAAEKVGVTVALEIHGDIMATGRAARPLIEEIGSPAIRIKYDTGNVEFYGGEKAVDDLPTVIDLLVNFDFKDKIGGPGEWNFPAPGSGHIDWDSLLRILDHAGYSGASAVEIEFQGEPWPALPTVTAAMRSARDHLLAVAAKI